VVRSAGKTLLPEHFEAAAGADQGASLSEGLDLGYHDAVRSFRQQLLVHALETTGGNRTRAAELLGVQRTYFMRLIRDLEDAPPAP
jgi:Nif-specific regulatory protein